MRNNGTCDVTDPWKAQLQFHVPGTGMFQGATYMAGTSVFPAGTDTVINADGTYDFCYQFASNVNAVRIEFSLDHRSLNCNPHAKSPAISPCNPTTPCLLHYSDMTTSSAFFNEVMSLSSTGAMAGYSDRTFRPGSLATRAQMAKIMALAFGLPIANTGTSHFTDVRADSPYGAYIEAVYSRGWIGGYSDGTFHASNGITRAQAAKMVVAAAGLKLVSPSSPSFSDVPASSALYSYVETAHANGLLSGYRDGTFRPNKLATRGQIAKIVYQAANPPQE